MNAANRQKAPPKTKTAAMVATLIALGLLTQTPATDAASADGPQRLRQAALSELQFAYANAAGRVEIEIANLDPRLQVPVCKETLQATVNRHNPAGGRVTVRVECRDDGPWTRHVAASVRVFQDIVVSSRALARGSIVGATDVTMKEQDISILRGQVIMDPAVAVGQSVRRAVSADTVLSIDLLEAPVLVKRGDRVVLIAQRGSIAIRETGTALQAGEAGKQIPVRNNSSERIVQAVVTGAGEVKVVF